MPPEEINFQTFFAAKVKDRGISIKKLSEATGIAPGHLEAMIHGRFDDLPSAPYVRGYLVRLGKALDFDGEAWWERVKNEGFAKNSGPEDSLPNNRFIRQSPAKFIWIGVAAILIIVYLAFQIPILFGKPTLAVIFPSDNPYTTASSTLIIEGTVQSANSLSLNGDSITVAQDGSWEKTVLLQNGLNTFDIVAKRLLGGSANITEQIFYQGFAMPATTTATSTNTGATSTDL
jgi:cytoskeletal protein RodZ